MRWNYIASGLGLMLLGAYLDNSRGPLLPAITRSLGIHYGQASWLFAAGNLAAVVSTFLLIPLSRLYGDRALALGSCWLGVVSIGLVTQVTGLWSLVATSALWGTTIATFGAVSNLLVLKGSDSASRARLFCGLHMMYGFGSLVGPWLSGSLIQAGQPWQAPLLVALPLFFLMGGFLYRTFPGGHDLRDMPPGAARLSRLQVLILVAFCAYVVGEVLTSTWMVTYLVEVERLDVGTASRYLVGFFLMMGLTRALCFFSLPPSWELAILAGSVVASLGFLVLGKGGVLWAFPLTGVLGPFFPLLMARVSRMFPSQSRALTLWILATVQLTLAVFQLSLGRIVDRVGLDKAYWLPAPLLLLSLGLLFFYRRFERARELHGPRAR